LGCRSSAARHTSGLRRARLLLVVVAALLLLARPPAAAAAARPPVLLLLPLLLARARASGVRPAGAAGRLVSAGAAALRGAVGRCGEGGRGELCAARRGGAAARRAARGARREPRAPPAPAVWRRSGAPAGPHAARDGCAGASGRATGQCAPAAGSPGAGPAADLHAAWGWRRGRG
jgi:hypothetical protein